MNAVELKDSDSSDNDVFIIKQIKPVNKITLPEALIIKYGVLNSFNSKRNKKKKKKDKIRKCGIESNKKQLKKSKVLSTVKNGNSQKQLSKPKSNNKSKNPSQIYNNNKKIFFDHIDKTGATNAKKKINLNIQEKESVCYSVNVGSVHKAESSKVSNFLNSFEKRNSDELSPEILKKKKCKLKDSTDRSIIPKAKKPLDKLFDMMENNTLSGNEHSENVDVNVIRKEGNNEVSLNLSKSDNVIENIKLEESLDIYEEDFIKSELPLEEFFSFDGFQCQNNFGDPSMERNVEKFIDSSELLTFLLKKIISDETKKQIYLEKLSLENGKNVEKLLSRSECKVLEKFFNLEHNACQVFVRMLNRKQDWHRVSFINYEEIGNNLENEFEVLHKENFVDVNIQNEDLKTQMHLLSKPEILKLCRAFNVFLKSNSSHKKEFLINSLIEDSKKQKSVMDMIKKKNPTSRLDLLKSEIKKSLGLCVRINEEIFQVFYKILLLFSFVHYYDEEKKRFNNELYLYFQVHKNMIKFVNYALSPTVVFETRTDFEEYRKSLLLQDDFETAINNKNYEVFASIFKKAKDEFMNLLKDHEYQHRYLKLKPFLQKFSAGTVYARILTKFCKTFKKRADNLEIITTVRLLLNQDIFLIRKKGEWYEILSKTLEILKENAAAAEVIVQSLKNPCINEVQRLTLQLRGQYILKKKTFGVNDNNLREVLDDICTPTVQEPPSIEIKGKVLDGNRSGFKSVYIQDFQHDKMFTSVEERAILYYKSNGFTRGYHAEGYIVQTIYFILFFDIIYGLSPEGVFQTPFQEAPLDLYSSSFYLNRKEDIDLLLNDMLVWDDEQIITKIKDTYCKNYCINCVIKWNDEFTPELFCEIIKCITMPILVRIFQRFVKNLRVARSGFPDLTLWNPETNKCKFVEVKSPNDKLSAAQRIWLDYLRNIGLDCEVCNVKSMFNLCIWQKLWMNCFLLQSLHQTDIIKIKNKSKFFLDARKLYTL